MKRFLNQMKTTLRSRLDLRRQQKQREHRAHLNREKAFRKALEKNPYLQSRALWNDMYGALEIKLENAYRIIVVLSLVIAIAMIGFVVIAGQSKVKPFVAVLHGNDLFTVNGLHTGTIEHEKPKLALFFAEAFIRNARSVSVDGDVNVTHKIAAYSLVKNAAASALDAYYKQNDPDLTAQTEVKDVAITSILEESPHTLTVRWQEASRNARTGQITQTQNYIAEMTYQYEKPSQDESVLANNPLGFYITELSWSVDQPV